MLNKAQLIGFLGADPEVRYTKEQEGIARVRLATSESWKKDGEKIEKTEWHNLVFFGRLAEVVREHLKKGSLIYAEGKLQTRSWDRDGETRYTTEIVVSEMKMLPSGGSKSKQASAPKAPGSPHAGPQEYDGPF